jgi:hypothetical protein
LLAICREPAVKPATAVYLTQPGSSDLAGAAHQIANKLASTACGQNQMLFLVVFIRLQLLKLLLFVLQFLA